MFIRLILKFLKPCPQLWCHYRKIGSKRAWVCTLCTRSDKKIKINNHKIFADSNSFLRSDFEHYKILMHSHPVLSRCDVINLKFGQERSWLVHHLQMMMKGWKWLFIEALRQIYWVLSTGFTNPEILILVLASLSLKLSKKT